MKAISKIIGETLFVNEKVKSYRERRPVVKMDAKSFRYALLENGNHILKQRGIDKEFVVDNDLKDIVNQLWLYANCDESCEYDLQKGLFLMGSIGTGKTVLMQSFLQLFNQDEKSKRIKIMDAIEFAGKTHVDRSNIDFYRQRPLFIDDLGRESKMIKSFGSKIEPIRELLSIRYHYGGISFLHPTLTLSPCKVFMDLIMLTD